MGKRLRALVVEDAPDDAELVIRELTRGGFDVVARRVEAADAMRAALKESRWDVVISDFGMPTFNGLDAFRIVQEMDAGLPFILVSGTVGEDVAVQAMRAGIQDYLLKSSLTRLAPAISRELGEAEARRARRAQFEVTRVLAESPGLAEAAPRLLEAVASALRWDFGQLWLASDESGSLAPTASWCAPGVEAAEFVALTFGTTLAPGVGIPGKVFRSGQPYYVGDVGRDVDETLPHRRAAAMSGLHALLALPIVSAGKPIGVYAVASREATAPGETLLATLADVGSQVGQFIARRRAEEALEKERHFLKALLDTLGEGIMACDEGGRLTLLNRKSRALYGLGEESDAADLDAARYALYAWDGKTPLRADQVPLHRALRGELVDDAEILIAPEGMKPRAILATSRPIVGETGKKMGAVVAMHDVTDRRLLEEQFRQAQKMEALGRLAGGVAHDFNNLLTAILGYAELLLLKTGEASPMARDLHEIRKAGERAASLTRQLLAFSRRQVVEPQIVEINTVVREAERMLGRLIGEDVELVTVLEPGLYPVMIDPGQLEQVLLNLVVNARDAMPEGGRLVIETANVDLDEAYARQHVDARPGPHAMLAVTDTGTGIPPEVMARVFEPFFTTKEKGKGTGLGLATVYGIVHQGGGHVLPYSELGHGTVFKIYLPRAARPKKGPSSGSAKKLGKGKKELVLVCEDDRAVSLLARRVLEDNGFAVRVAASGEEAAETTKGGAPDLLVTDTVLPGMTGLHLIAALRAASPGLPAILMSGYTEGTLEVDGPLPYGVVFLQKPFAPAALLKKVRQALGRDT